MRRWWWCATGSRARRAPATCAGCSAICRRAGWPRRRSTFAAARASPTACRASTTRARPAIWPRRSSGWQRSAPAGASRSPVFRSAATWLPSIWASAATPCPTRCARRWWWRCRSIWPAARALDGPGLAARLYRERFLRKLKPKALAKSARFAGHLDDARIRGARTLRDFDDAVTAPLHGFATAEEYYARSSSAGFLAGVRRPLLILQAADDPFIPEETLPLAAARATPWLELELSAGGGHVAFVAGPPWWPHRFAERRAAAWLEAKLG